MSTKTERKALKIQQPFVTNICPQNIVITTDIKNVKKNNK